MNKPLKDWTLEELQKYCKITQCVDCCIGLWCKNLDECPSEWNLSEPPRWTEQDKEDARKIKAIFPDNYSLDVSRLDDGRLKLVIIQSLSFILINDELLPSLKPGESATLYEIIGGKEND